MIFVSYSRKDRNLVFPLVNLLRATNQKMFLDLDQLEFGKDWQAQLVTAIKHSERMLLFWSKSSSKSEVIKKEWEEALKQDCKIVPVILDKTPLPKEIAGYHGTEELSPIFLKLKKIKFYQRIASFFCYFFGVIIFLGFFALSSNDAESGNEKDDEWLTNFIIYTIIGIFFALIIMRIILSWRRRLVNKTVSATILRRVSLIGKNVE